MVQWFHGGIAGLAPGDRLVPSPPHVTDGCPVCLARATGKVCTVAQFRAWATKVGALQALEELEDAPDDAPLDPPSQVEGVYLTRSSLYAAWYASRSQGDLYLVAPEGEAVRSTEDVFSTVIVPAARVLQVLRRRVVLLRAERRELKRQWARAERIYRLLAQAGV